jgi:hypothetical protein
MIWRRTIFTTEAQRTQSKYYHFNCREIPAIKTHLFFWALNLLIVEYHNMTVAAVFFEY